MENTREKNKRADGRKKTYFDRENKKKAARTEKTKSVAPEKGKQKKSSSSSKCPYQKKCGGCTYLNLSYEEQLAKKEQFLKKTLKGIVPVKGMVGMENPYHYRNKVNSAFARKKDGTIISGIYEKGTHKVVPVSYTHLDVYKRQAALLTDGIRAKLLENAGYETQILEFIDMEHTPKNLLIRAVKRQEGSKKLPEELKVCMEAYHVKPTLADLLTEKEEP